MNINNKYMIQSTFKLLQRLYASFLCFSLYLRRISCIKNGFQDDYWKAEQADSFHGIIETFWSVFIYAFHEH